MEKFSKREMALMKKLNTPARVQDFLNQLNFNFEEDGVDTIKSPLRVLRTGSAHCFEGAIFGAYILSLHGHKPLILYLKTTLGDFDHVIAPFQIDGLWGALSKTNHSVLRYREPIYKNVRELVMSYFHEYFLDSGEKTLRQYSDVLDLSKIPNWETSSEDLWIADEMLDQMRHFDIAPQKVFKNLRNADKIEIKAGKIVEYKKR